MEISQTVQIPNCLKKAVRELFDHPEAPEDIKEAVDKTPGLPQTVTTDDGAEYGVVCASVVIERLLQGNPEYEEWKSDVVTTLIDNLLSKMCEDEEVCNDR